MKQRFGITATTVLLWILATGAWASAEVGQPNPPAPTFTRDVAPIVFEHCAGCHRPGGPAPFALLDYDGVRGRARQIVDVVRTGYMPPWLPEDGHLELQGRRALTEGQVSTLVEWRRRGTPEGEPEDLPPPPEWPDGWRLGQPDLVVELPQPFLLPAEGFDVFRNFVLPLPIAAGRYVRSVELQPGNASVVHHAVMQVDPSRASRLLDEADPEPGFDGMDMGDSTSPEGHLLGWTPGTVPFAGYEGIAWRLEPGTDLVLQMHMRPTGKLESIRPRVGLYFADGPPTGRLWGFTLYTTTIDIPAGESNYVVENSFRLPAPIDLLAIYPHAHYLGKQIRAWATFPDGSREALIEIPDWDFNWQDQYRYANPVSLPAGTTLTMRYVYDNSSSNPRNPNSPPRRVRLGNQSADEMGTLSFESLPRMESDLPVLKEALARQRLVENPRNWIALTNLGVALEVQGRLEQAIASHREALQINPEYAAAHYGLAVALHMSGREEEASREYTRTLELQPHHPRALYNLALTHQLRGRLAEAIELYRRALGLTPDDTDLLNNLGNALADAGQLEEAIVTYERALSAQSDSADLHSNLGRALARSGRLEEAIREFRVALELDPDSSAAQRNLEIALRELERTQSPEP